MTDHYGFIGLGQMGAPMATNLSRIAPLVVLARNPSRAEQFSASGVAIARQASDFSACSAIFLCLPDGDSIESVLFGAFSLAKALSPGTIVVDTSTIEYARTLSLAERLKQDNIIFVDAPVSGMQTRAEAGTLTMMCGGEVSIIEKLRPILSSMASTILHMGPTGHGQLTKLINQLLFDINAAALAEILPLAVKLGLDPDKIGQVVNTGTGRSYASEFFIPNMLKGDFTKGYPMGAAYKDLVSGAEVSAHYRIPMPVLAAATAVYQTALLAGHGEKDKGGMICTLEAALGVKFRSQKTGENRP